MLGGNIANGLDPTTGDAARTNWELVIGSAAESCNLTWFAFSRFCVNLACKGGRGTSSRRTKWREMRNPLLRPAAVGTYLFEVLQVSEIFDTLLTVNEG